ncbi:MAG: ferric reductase-like transmembrane domain-containing protein [Candidatus Bathyarchaeota archaeon]|nr:ferric reductase-like transmembrane domain-containing protein [Candidatus Bathyarchaeota archaeon]
MFAAVVFFSSLPAALALPDSNTGVIGVDCGAGHLVSYSFSFQYPDSLEVGKAATLKIKFTLKSSQVTQNPVKVSAKIIADGFDVSVTALDLLSTNTLQVTPLRVGGTIRVVTSLVLDGDTKQHPGYKGTYTDTFTLKGFNIVKPSGGGTQTGAGGTQTGTNSTQTGTGGTQTGNSTQTGGGGTQTGGGGTQMGGGGTTTPTNSTGTGSTSGTNSTTGASTTPPDVVSEGDVSVYTIKVGNDVLVTVTIEFGELSLVAWYTVRVVGLLAYFALSLSMLFAVFLKINRRAFPSLTKWHHEISIISVVLSLIHAVNNLLDASVWRLGVDRVFWLNFSTPNAIWVSLGVLSLYLMIVVTASSFKSVMKRIRFPRWRMIHVSSYILYAFVLIHSLLLGTDMNLLGSTSALGLFVNFLFILMASANLVGVLFILATRRRGARA